MKNLFWIVLAMVIASSPLLAVDDSVFELEGDAVEQVDDDWSTLYGGGGGASLFTFIVDKNGSDTIFTGGGSKVPLDFPGYKWKSSPPPPDKSNITNAYAANYLVAGEQVLYFGADLFAVNGDVELAYWFLQDDVGLNPNGTFHGVHVEGDVYVAVKFSNGGSLATGAVYDWYPPCTRNDRTPTLAGSCAADNIRIVIPSGPALCDGLGGKNGCVITNLANAVSPWPYVPKAGPPGIFPPTSFFEGGINIKQIFGENLCFSAFMVATGASTSFNSTAKDFALGDFNVCSVAASKECVNPNEADDTPTAITYTIYGCAWNDGAGDILLASLVDNVGGFGNYVPSDLYLAETLPGFDPAIDCDNATALAAQIAGGAEVTDPATYPIGADEALVYTFTQTTAINGPSDVVTITATGVDGAVVDPATAGDTCPPRVFDAGMDVSKTCEATVEDAGATLVVKIKFGGQVCNDGEVDLVNLSLDDYVAGGTVVFDTYANTVTAGNCISYTGYYYPDSIPSGDVCPFMDMVTAVSDAPVNSAGTDCVKNSDDTSTCTVNSNSATCKLRVTNDDGDCTTGLPDPTP